MQALNKKSIDANIALYLAHLKEEDKRQKKERLPKSLQEDLYLRAFCFYEKGHYEEAEEHFNKLVVADTFECKYWFGLAATLQLELKYEEALRAWSIAALLDYMNPYPHFHAAECLISLGETKDALLALQEAEKRAVADALMQKIDTLKQVWEKEVNK